MPCWYVKSARTLTRHNIVECSVKLFVNPIWSSVTVPIAERLPCGLVESVDDVCAIGDMFTIFVPPPRYSDRHPALGVVTPKCDFIISTYRVPPRASRSNSF